VDIMKFITKPSSHSTLHIGYKEKYTEQTVNTNFLALQTDNHINWKNHIAKMIPQLSATCYAVRSTVHIRNMGTLISIYCAQFHSVIKYGKSFGKILPTVGRLSLYKIKSSEL